MPISGLSSSHSNLPKRYLPAPELPEHGIFIGLTTDLIIAEQSRIRHLQRHNDQIVET
jgi:hypothetical protein